MLCCIFSLHRWKSFNFYKRDNIPLLPSLGDESKQIRVFTFPFYGDHSLKHVMNGRFRDRGNDSRGYVMLGKMNDTSFIRGITPVQKRTILCLPLCGNRSPTYSLLKHFPSLGNQSIHVLRDKVNLPITMGIILAIVVHCQGDKDMGSMRRFLQSRNPMSLPSITLSVVYCQVDKNHAPRLPGERCMHFDSLVWVIPISMFNIADMVVLCQDLPVY